MSASRSPKVTHNNMGEFMHKFPTEDKRGLAERRFERMEEKLLNELDHNFNDESRIPFQNELNYGADKSAISFQLEIDNIQP